MASTIERLTLLSGKGGSGKTVIALSMCKVLTEAGCKVLLVDCDTSTHGATYFFEADLPLQPDTVFTSLADLVADAPRTGEVLRTRVGFWFIPSTLNPAEEQEQDSRYSNEEYIDNAFRAIDELCVKLDIGVVIFDCQAGYSAIAREAAHVSQSSLIVLEPDSVSSAALRVLYLQIGSALKRSNTWQIFNKLTEEERPVYEKVFGGTLFPNLPPIPFDWQVRAAFSTSEIPSITSNWSAFGLGVLRIMKTLFPNYAAKLTQLETETVGNWYTYLKSNIEKLSRRKDEITYKRVEKNRRERLTIIRYIFIASYILTILLFLSYLLGRILGYSIFKFLVISPEVLLAIIAFMITVGSMVWYRYTVRNIREEREQDIEQESITTIEAEINKFVTLVATDPSLREYEKSRVVSEKVPA
jgi:cellulose biosynthesis protein BcsQ